MCGARGEFPSGSWKRNEAEFGEVHRRNQNDECDTGLKLFFARLTSSLTRYKCKDSEIFRLYDFRME